MTEIITINNFTKIFGRQKAVDNLSFSVNKGEIFAFLGTNGSGKTTTIRCLLDIYRPTAGELLIKGQKYTYELSKSIGYLPEERGIYTKAKVRDLFIYFANLRGIPTHEANVLMKRYLKKVDLEGHEDKQIIQLSSGMQQKVQLGLAFIHKPELLILDEPFKGLDPLNRQLFIDMFKELKKEGATILYSTHVIDEAQKLTDSLVIINKGKRKAFGKTEAIRQEHGSKIIHLEYSGNFPVNSKLYSSKATSKVAEITPKDNIKPEEVLRFLLANDIEIINYKLDYPSLNEIFIKLTKDND